MEIPDAGLEQARQMLKDLRQILLTLHKALLDSERTSYEIVNGPIPSATAFLQLLINDDWFQWLRPITTLIVQIDESLAAKKPPATARDLEQLAFDLRALLSPSREVNGFWKRYSTVVQRDPGVAVLHNEMQKRFD